MRSLVFVVIATFFVGVSGAQAQKGFVPLPEFRDGASPSLELRIVNYSGSTNGQMQVEVRNIGTRTEDFTAEGLYFVPNGDPEKAPQRLGAAGPFTELPGNKHVQRTQIAPGQSKRLSLEVFCIDSHRASPSSGTKFSIAKKRMPKALVQDIDKEAAVIVRKNKGDVKRSVSEIQTATWKHRDKKWIKLEGERKVEKKPANKHAPRHPQRIRRPR